METHGQLTYTKKITSERGKKLLEQLKDWLPEAKFKVDGEGNRKYNDEGLDAKVMPLLKDLQLDVCYDASYLSILLMVIL